MDKLALYPIQPVSPGDPWVLEGEHPPSDGVWVLGRSPLASVHLTDHRVSKHHAEVRATSIQQGRDTCWFWEVQDTHSSNGTWLNNRLLYPRAWNELAEYDTLRLGDTVLRISFDVEDTSSGQEPNPTRIGTPAPAPAPAPASEATTITAKPGQPWWAEWVEAVWAWWTHQHPLMQWLTLVTSGLLAALLLWVWKL